MIRAVVRDEIDQPAMADPSRLIAHRRATRLFPNAWLSPQRVIVAQGRRVLEAWPLADLFDVRALDDLTGWRCSLVSPTLTTGSRCCCLTSFRGIPKWAGLPPPGYGLRRVDLDGAEGRGRLRRPARSAG